MDRQGQRDEYREKIVSEECTFQFKVCDRNKQSFKSSVLLLNRTREEKKKEKVILEIRDPYLAINQSERTNNLISTDFRA